METDGFSGKATWDRAQNRGEKLVQFYSKIQVCTGLSRNRAVEAWKMPPSEVVSARGVNAFKTPPDEMRYKLIPPTENWDTRECKTDREIGPFISTTLWNNGPQAQWMFSHSKGGGVP